MPVLFPLAIVLHVFLLLAIVMHLCLILVIVDRQYNG
jgi:hypothetical protein